MSGYWARVEQEEYEYGGGGVNACMAGYMIYFIKCNWVATRWQQYSTHLHATIHRTTQNKQYIEQHKNFGRVRPVPRFAGFTLKTEDKVRKSLSQGGRRVPAGTTKIHKHTIRIHKHK